MPKPSYDSRHRERVGPNLYRRVTKDGRERFDAAFRDTDGRVRFSALEATSQRAAERKVRAMLTKRDCGELIVGSSDTVRAFVESDYLPLIDSLAAAGTRSERGVDSDRARWRLHLEQRLGHVPLGKLEGRHVSELVRDMREDGYSEGTIQRVLVVLQAIIRLARTRKKITRSPVDELDKSERPKPRQGGAGSILDEIKLDTLVRHAPERYRVAVTVLAYSGLRISEVLGLRWRDIDFVASEISVNGQIQPPTRRTPATRRVERLKSDASLRFVPMFPAVEEALVRHLAAEQMADRGGDDQLIFQTRTGQPLSARNVAQRGVEKAATSAGLGHITPKDLRASFCSLAGRRGVDPAEAAQMTGHSLAVWARFYARSFGREQRAEARDRMLEHGFGAELERTKDAHEGEPSDDENALFAEAEDGER